MVIAMLLCCVFASSCGKKAQFERVKDVVYGRKFGTALTMNIVKPRHPNGSGVIWIVSGGWRSEPPPDDTTSLLKPFLDRGYTVFLVVHGSQPRYNMVDIVSDLRRSVRFIRRNAATFNIYPDRLAVHGASSGGHLALMLATESIPGDPDSADPVDQEPCKVQAVAAVAPPTDFLNYGQIGARASEGPLKPFAGGFDYDELDPGGTAFVKITDAKKRDDITRQMSPINRISADTAPVIIFQGDVDSIVPLQQSTTFIDKLKQHGVPCELIVKKGWGHDFRSVPDYLVDMEKAAVWFDRYVRKINTAKSD